jgi:hypothetical protein
MEGKAGGHNDEEIPCTYEILTRTKRALRSGDISRPGAIRRESHTNPAGPESDRCAASLDPFDGFVLILGIPSSA